MLHAAPCDDKLTCPVIFAGAELLLDARRALYWPAAELLIVSDLHFGKGAFLARHGSALPALDTHDTLLRLAALIAHYRPQRVVCLGDSFHDAKAYLSLAAADRTLLHDLAQSVADWHWILGNHDPFLAEELPGSYQEWLEIAGILLTHEPLAVPTLQPQLIGHFHPKAMMRVGGRRVAGPSFMLGERLLIMPAFGSYTGGLDCADPVITGLFDGKPDCRFIYNGKIWKA